MTVKISKQAYNDCLASSKLFIPFKFALFLSQFSVLSGGVSIPKLSDVISTLLTPYLATKVVCPAYAYTMQKVGPVELVGKDDMEYDVL